MNTWKVIPLVVSVAGAAMLGACSTRELASGGAGGAVGYEYSNKRAMDALEEDYKAGRIDKEEYDRRREEIESRSIIQ